MKAQEIVTELQVYEVGTINSIRRLAASLTKPLARSFPLPSDNSREFIYQISY